MESFRSSSISPKCTSNLGIGLGADFELTVNIQTMNNDRVVATIREGTPFHTVVELSATGGTLQDRFTFVGPGATESEPIQTYPNVAGTPVIIKVESVRFQENGLLAYSYYDGFTVKAGQHLTGVTASDTESTVPTGATAQLQTVSTPVPTPEPTTEPVMPLVQEPTEPPAAPTNLTSANGNGSITLSWNAPNDDTITGYEILRRRPTEGERRLTTYVANTLSTATTYTDTNVTAGVKPAYRVKAINAAGSSGVSNFVLVTPYTIWEQCPDVVPYQPPGQPGGWFCLTNRIRHHFGRWAPPTCLCGPATRHSNARHHANLDSYNTGG